MIHLHNYNVQELITHYGLHVETKHFVPWTILNPSQHAQRWPFGIGIHTCSQPPLRWLHALVLLASGGQWVSQLCHWSIVNRYKSINTMCPLSCMLSDTTWVYKTIQIWSILLCRKLCHHVFTLMYFLEITVSYIMLPDTYDKVWTIIKMSGVPLYNKLFYYVIVHK